MPLSHSELNRLIAPIHLIRHTDMICCSYCQASHHLGFRLADLVYLAQVWNCHRTKTTPKDCNSPLGALWPGLLNGRCSSLAYPSIRHSYWQREGLRLCYTMLWSEGGSQVICGYFRGVTTPEYSFSCRLLCLFCIWKLYLKTCICLETEILENWLFFRKLFLCSGVILLIKLFLLDWAIVEWVDMELWINKPNIIYWWHFLFHSDWVCGGQWNRMVQFLAVLMQTVQNNNIELAVFFNGALEQQRLNEWVRQECSLRKNINSVSALSCFFYFDNLWI